MIDLFELLKFVELLRDVKNHLIFTQRNENGSCYYWGIVCFYFTVQILVIYPFSFSVGIGVYYFLWSYLSCIWLPTSSIVLMCQTQSRANWNSPATEVFPFMVSRGSACSQYEQIDFHLCQPPCKHRHVISYTIHCPIKSSSEPFACVGNE